MIDFGPEGSNRIWRSREMRNFIKVMKALRDPNRVKIVKMLQHGELCVCEIQKVLRVSQPAVSKHLKILQEAGFLNSRKDRLWVCYRLDDGSSSPYVAPRYWGTSNTGWKKPRRSLRLQKDFQKFEERTYAAHNLAD